MPTAAETAHQAVQLDTQISALTAEAETLMQEEETARNKRIAVRRKREELSNLRNTLGIQIRIATADEAAALNNQATAKARQEAEQIVAENQKLTTDLETKNKRAEEILAGLEKRAAAITDPGT